MKPQEKKKKDFPDRFVWASSVEGPQMKKNKWASFR